MSAVVKAAAVFQIARVTVATGNVPRRRRGQRTMPPLRDKPTRKGGRRADGRLVSAPPEPRQFLLRLTLPPSAFGRDAFPRGTVPYLVGGPEGGTLASRTDGHTSLPRQHGRPKTPRSDAKLKCTLRADEQTRREYQCADDVHREASLFDPCHRLILRGTADAAEGQPASSARVIVSQFLGR